MINIVLPITFVRNPGFLCRNTFRHEEFRPLINSTVPRTCILNCDYRLVDLDGKVIVSSKIPPLSPIFLPIPPSPTKIHVIDPIVSVCATNSANVIRLLRNLTAILALPVITGVVKVGSRVVRMIMVWGSPP